MPIHPIWFINSALVNLRQSPLTEAGYDAENLSGSPSNQKTWARRKTFESVLPDVLRSHNWNCITKRAELTEDTANTPVWGFTRRYLLPSDFIRMTEISLDNTLMYSVDIDKKFRLEDDESVSVASLVCNASIVQIRYVYMPTSFTLDGLPASHAEYVNGDYTVPDVMQTFLGKFDFSLRNAVIERLEKEFAYPLTGSTQIEQLRRDDYQRQIAEAQSNDSQDDGPETISSTVLTDVRF
jgi:hypothetical protein